MPFCFFFFCHSRGGWAGGGVPGGFTPAAARFLEGRGARCSPGRRRCQAGRIRSWYDHRSQITDQPPTKAGKTTLYHGRHGERQAGPEWLSAAGLGRLQLGTATRHCLFGTFPCTFLSALPTQAWCIYVVLMLMWCDRAWFDRALLHRPSNLGLTGHIRRST